MERKTTSFGMDRRTLVAGMAAVPALAFTQGAFAQQNPMTAIDIALEPDATMVQHAKDANARLLKSFPKGFSPAGASVYQLGTFGTARKELTALTLAP